MRTRIIFSLIAVFFNGFCCHNKKIQEIAAPCYYSLLSKDSISFDVNKYKIDVDFIDKADNFRQAFYYTYDYDGGNKTKYTVVFSSDETKHFIYKFDNQNHIEYRRVVSESKLIKINELIDRLLRKEDKFITRKCLISGGARGVFLIKKGNSESIQYFFESDGYECDIIGEDGKMADVVELVKLLKKLN